MTVEQKNKIIEMREKGMGYSHIANVLGISKNTVKSFCHRQLHISDEPNNSGVCRQCGKECDTFVTEKVAHKSANNRMKIERSF